MIISRLRFTYKSTVIFTIIAFTASACAIQEFPSFFLNARDCKNYKEHNNVAIGVDPFVEKDRLKKYFGVDLLNEYTDGIPTDGIILPIYVVTENKSNNTAILSMSDINLSTLDGKVVVTAVDGLTAGIPVRMRVLNREKTLNKAAEYTTPIIGLTFLVLLTTPLTLKIPNARDMSTDNSLSSKSLLPEKSILSGKVNNGFAFFLLNEKDIEYLSTSSILKVSIKNLDTNEKTIFELETNLKDMNKRVMKHNNDADPIKMP